MTSNDVLGGYTKEVHCSRCKGPRWVRVDTPEPYKCQRCRLVAAGRPADDPLGSVRQQEARKAAGERLKGLGGKGRLLGDLGSG